jgi:hypothetical protein
MSRRSVSIFLELTELQGAIEAARTAVVGLQGMPPHAPESSDGLVQVGAVLALVIERVRLLREAVEGCADPSLLLARHNVVESESNDLVLELWQR